MYLKIQRFWPKVTVELDRVDEGTSQRAGLASNRAISIAMTMDAYSSKADSELVALLQAGDRRAFEVMYRRYAALLFRYVADKLTTHREDCEEIVQETFVWLWSHRESLSHVTELRPYLYGIVKHKIFNYIRHNVIRREYADHFLKFGSIVDNSNEEQSNLSDIMRLLDNAITQLPERCQTAFKLSRIEHLPIATIAEQMNISTRTVENYITQALKHLREAVRQFYRSHPDNNTNPDTNSDPS